MADGNDRPSDEQLFSKKASFVQHSLPGLEAGVYEISVTQKFQTADGTLIDEEGLPVISKRFGVSGPKYSIPTTAVLSEYPPRASAGGYSNSLPHVVMTMEKLPWIRSPYLPGNEPTIEEHQYQVTYDGKTTTVAYDDDKATWLAVLTISPSDIGGADPNSLITVNGTAKQLVPKKWTVKDGTTSPVQGQLDDHGYSIFSYTLEPGQAAPQGGTVDPGVGYTGEEACTFIDIPASLFSAIAPSLADLQMMAHIRSVEMDSKPIADNASTNAVQSFSLVVGNRLPETMAATEIPPAPQPEPALGSNLALLVSLEHMENALRGCPSTGYYAQTVAKAADGFVRLPVLYKWDFVSWPDSSFDFVHLLKGLNGRDPDAANDGPPLPSPRFRRAALPDYQNPTQEQTIVQQMMELGYTPMNHLTRVPDTSSGEAQPIQTVSWYRGPFAPFAVEPTQQFLSGLATNPDAQQELVYSADQLLRFDPQIGIYDTSYAAAWQIGQLVSLQDKSFSTALYRWKKTTDHKYRMLLEDAVLQDGYSGLIQNHHVQQARRAAAAAPSAVAAAQASAAAGKPDSKLLYKGLMTFLASSSAKK